jgi:WD40 repeat protein
LIRNELSSMPNIQIQLTEFSDLITRYTADFVGREWLVKQVNALLDEPDCRFVVLTGGPGVGKTAFMAHLAATHPQWPRYFIRRDSRDLLRPGDASTFLLTIGGQLATLYPHLFHPENLEVVVRQRVGDVEAGGEAIGARIEELRASSFYHVALRVEQEIQRVVGKATALEIGHLVSEPRLLQMQDLQYLGMLDPARLLAQKNPEARIVVLVDALDELRYSPAEPDILRALRELPEIPPNLRFVISSRPEAFLDRLLARGDAREMPLDVAGAKNQADLRTYAESALIGDGLSRALTEEGQSPEAFVEGLLHKAAGNFLYLKSVLSGIQEALEDPAKHDQLNHLLRVEELPDDLGALYGYFLASIVDWAERWGFGDAAWKKYLSPVLGVLAVAQEPLNEEQLIAFTGLRRRDIRDLLREVRQFIEVVEGPCLACRIYHSSLAEYLLDSERNPTYWIDPVYYHRQIAGHYYETYINRWSDCDLYGLRHLPEHLFEAGTTENLRRLLFDFDWLQAKLYATDVNALIADYDSLPNGADLRLVQGAIRLAAHVLTQDRTQFRSQLYGRLIMRQIREIRAMLQEIEQLRSGPWLRPLTPSLDAPGGILVRTLTGHRAGVADVAVAADKRWGVSASFDCTLRIWDLETGELLRTIHQGQQARAVTLLPDGRQAICGSYDHTVKVWNLETGNVVTTLGGHTGRVIDVALTPDGRFAVSGSSDCTLRIWDLECNKTLFTLAGHTDEVHAVAVTPDGQCAISASKDRTLRVWDLYTGVSLRTLKGHSLAVNAVVVTPDGQSVISGSSDKSLRVWDLKSGASLATLEGHSASIRDIAVTSDGRHAISASNDQTLKVWDLHTKMTLCTLKGHTGSVNAVMIMPNERHIVSGSNDGTLKVWDLESGIVLQNGERYLDYSFDISVCESGQQLARSDLNKGDVKNWTLANQVGRRGLEGHRDSITAVAILPNSSHALSGSKDRSLALWDLETGARVHIMKGHKKLITAIAVTPDCRRAISGSGDCTVRMWDLETGTQLSSLKGHTNRITAVAVTPDGRRALSASWDTTLILWDLESGRALRTLKGHTGSVRAATVTVLGHQAISASRDGTIKVWDLKSGKALRTLRILTKSLRAMVVTPDGRQAFSATRKTLRVWDLESGTKVHDLECPKGVIQDLALTVDGRRAVSTSDDKTLRVWDLDSGRILCGFSGEVPFHACSLAPDRVTIVAGDTLGRLHILRLEGVE